MTRNRANRKPSAGQSCGQSLPSTLSDCVTQIETGQKAAEESRSNPPSMLLAPRGAVSITVFSDRLQTDGMRLDNG